MDNEEPRRLFISFSGGETSAYMTWWLWTYKRHLYDEIVILFANTGQEREETLEFVERFSQHFGIPVVWVEAEVSATKGVGTTYRVVDFETASRHGRPFEDVISVYGIPNAAYPHCTRELKQQPMHKYVRKFLRWSAGTYDTAIGIRKDEEKRKDPMAAMSRLVYPLCDENPMSKPAINAWWRNQPFRLQLKGYEGNCTFCWKKSLRKLMTLVTERPQDFDFPERMERQYGGANNSSEHPDRVFFRQNKSTAQLREMARTTPFTPATDDHVIYEEQLDMDLDEEGGGCSDHCEPDFADMAIS